MSLFTCVSPFLPQMSSLKESSFADLGAAPSLIQAIPQWIIHRADSTVNALPKKGHARREACHVEIFHRVVLGKFLLYVQVILHHFEDLRGLEQGFLWIETSLFQFQQISDAEFRC